MWFWSVKMIELVSGMPAPQFGNEFSRVWGSEQFRTTPGTRPLRQDRMFLVLISPASSGGQRFVYQFPIPVPDAADSYEDYEPYAEDSVALYSDDSTAMTSNDSYGRGIYNPRIECQLYSPSMMLRRTPNHPSEQSLVYVYETGSRKRKMALPKGNLRARGAPVPSATLLRRHSTNSHSLGNDQRWQPTLFSLEIVMISD
jgi:hypothetical protein